MSTSFIPELFVQCCDADLYLEIGKQCAEQHICHGDLRPGGAYYWFSWPERLGLSSTAFVWANFFLLILSALLATSVLLSVCKRSDDVYFMQGYFSKIILGTASLVIHLIFFWPTIFTTLSDPPSALLLLNGIWLLLLSCLIANYKRPWLIFLAGLCLGGAAWIRAFYLYPVLAGVIVGCIALLVSPQRKIWHCLLLFALMFPSYQLFKTYKAFGTLAYLNGDQSNHWTDIHLSSARIGSDTLFQKRHYFSEPHYCQISNGLLDSVQQKDYASLLCLIGNRAAFYLATYRSLTYIYPNIKNQLYPYDIEEVGGQEKIWPRFNLNWQQDVASDPAGGITADKMTVQSAKPDGGTATQQTVALPGDTDYTFSVWLWSDEPAAIQLSFQRQGDDLPLSVVMASITKKRQRFFMRGKTINFGNYTVRIGAPTTIMAPVFGGSMSDTLYAWGAQLEKGSVMTEYTGIQPLMESDIRSWHTWLLLANGMALILALLITIRFRQIFLLEPVGVMAIVIVCAVFAEALVIIPEQRFCAAFMVFIWVLAAGLVFTARTGPNRGKESE